ncbi:Conserved hypothetical protein [Candidatus Phytoplasma australiense]|uniref:Immunodominant membrane protein n=2 Tax=Phytoplasma australiense TaxID=59748 RepID=B1VAJ0_PHYAS|nr:Conserved hypothetical protein [Candidatus Phytoplasma australiense]
MKFVITKRNKIIIGVIFIITSLYLGLGFWISFKPIDWLSPYKTWARSSGKKLVTLVKDLEKNQSSTSKKTKNKIKSIENQLETIKHLVIERYKNQKPEEIKEIKELHTKLKTIIDEINKKDEINETNYKKIEDKSYEINSKIERLISSL